MKDEDSDVDRPDSNPDLPKHGPEGFQTFAEYSQERDISLWCVLDAMPEYTVPTAMEKLLMVTVLILAFGGMLSITALLFAAAPGEVFLGTLLFLLIIASLVNAVVTIRVYGVLNYIAKNRQGSGTKKAAKKGKK